MDLIRLKNQWKKDTHDIKTEIKGALIFLL